MKIDFKYNDILALIFIIVIFVLCKISFLNLPYYWDEAWSYKPAIEEMFIKGPSLLPNSISVENYKGHPLLFYFLTSTFLSIFGNTIIVSKIFALIISILVLIIVFVFVKSITNNKLTSLFAVLVLLSQSIFLAQSTLVLPEMLLALFSLLSLFFYHKKNKLLFVISTSLLLLTKETGIVLFFSIIIGSFISNFNYAKEDLIKYLKQNIYLILPIIPFGIFFIFQKIMLGWFFYPEHIGYIEFGDAFINKLIGYLSYLVIYQGRNIILLTLLLSIGFVIFKKKKILYKNELLLMFIFIIFYLLFSSINFYATRYSLSLIPVFIIISVLFVDFSFDNKIVKIIFFSSMMISSLYYSSTHKKDNDHSIGYENVISVQQNMIRFCEDKEFRNKNIATNFLMRVYLTDSIMGYLSSSSVFKNVSDKITETTDLTIISSNEDDKDINNYIKKNDCKLIIEFKKEQAWCKLYSLGEKKL